MKMLNIRMILILSVIFTLTGATVALADSNMPGTPLYGTKLAIEQVRLKRITDPSQIANQHLALAQKRTQELTRLARAGEVPGESVRMRIEENLNAALQLCMQLGEGDRQGSLVQAQNMIQAQIRELNRVRAQATVPTQGSLDQTIAMMEAALIQVNALSMGSNKPEGQTQPGPGEPGGNPDCLSINCEPVGDQHQYGPQPEQPGPGETGGDPDCPSEGCEPTGDQHQYGPQPELPGPGVPGGNPDCPSEGCEPTGDQHQHHNDPQPPGLGGSGGGHNRP
jgi:hypothetical protein